MALIALFIITAITYQERRPVELRYFQSGWLITLDNGETFNVVLKNCWVTPWMIILTFHHSPSVLKHFPILRSSYRVSMTEDSLLDGSSSLHELRVALQLKQI